MAARPDLAVIASRVIDQTNNLRARNGLARVGIEAQLSHAAQGFAEFMAETDRIAHDADGHAAEERVKASGYSYCMVAENLAYVVDSFGFTTEQLAARLMQSWEKSPPHRRNLLLAPVTQIGVGVAQSPRTRRFYAVQLLARPDSAALHFEVANRAGTTIEYVVDDDRYALAPLVTRLHGRCADATLRLIGTGARDSPVAIPDGSRYVVDRDDAGTLRLRSE